MNGISATAPEKENLSNGHKIYMIILTRVNGCCVACMNMYQNMTHVNVCDVNKTERGRVKQRPRERLVSAKWVGDNKRHEITR